MPASAINPSVVDVDGPVAKTTARDPDGRQGLKEVLTAIKSAIAACEDGTGLNLSGLTLSDNDIDGNDRLLVIQFDADGNIVGPVSASLASVQGSLTTPLPTVTQTETLVDGSTYTIEPGDASEGTDDTGLVFNTIRLLNASPATPIAVTFPASSTITAALKEFVIICDLEQTGGGSIEPASGGTINGGTDPIEFGPGSVVTVTVLENGGSAPRMLAVGPGTDGDLTLDDVITFTVAPVFTDKPGSRAALGLTPRVLASGFRGVPPATLGAAPFTRAGASTPAEQVFQGWAFDGATDEFMDFGFRVPGWFPASTGVAVKFATVSTATSGNMVFQAAFRRINTTEDIDVSHTYTAQSSGAVATSATSGSPAYVTITFTSSQIDAFVAGEMVVLRINRDADNTSATDSITADDVVLLEASLVVEEV